MAYWIRDGSGGLRQRRQLVRGKWWELAQREGNKKDKTKLTLLLLIPANYTGTLSPLCALALSVPC